MLRKMSEADIGTEYQIFPPAEDKRHLEYDSATILVCIGEGLFKRRDTGLAVTFTSGALIKEID